MTRRNNEGTFGVYSYWNDYFDVHIFDEFSYEKTIFSGISSWKLKQQLYYIQLGQDDDITKSWVFEKQKPHGVRCMKMELGHIHPMSKMIIVLVFDHHKQD